MVKRFKIGPKPGRGGPSPKPIEHGTHSGFNTHRKRGEIPCRPCLAGERAYQNAYDQRGKCAKGLGWPLEAHR